MTRIERRTADGESLQVPRPLLGAPGRFEVHATWGTVQPLQIAPGVRTIDRSRGMHDWITLGFPVRP